MAALRGTIPVKLYGREVARAKVIKSEINDVGLLVTLQLEDETPELRALLNNNFEHMSTDMAAKLV